MERHTMVGKDYGYSDNDIYDNIPDRTYDASKQLVIMHEYEEFHEWSPFWSWAFIAFLSGSLITICMVAMMMIKDVPRQWNFGDLDFTPSGSVYSLVKPGSVVEKMVEPLPEGITMEEDRTGKRTE